MLMMISITIMPAIIVCLRSQIMFFDLKEQTKY